MYKISFEEIVHIYRKNCKNLGFIPNTGLLKHYKNGDFFYSDYGFILIGSLKSDITPIYSVYVYPEKRNGSTKFVIEMLKKLPRKKYRVRCHFGELFWIKIGLSLTRVENNNSRKRTIKVLEGEFNF